METAQEKQHEEEQSNKAPNTRAREEEASAEAMEGESAAKSIADALKIPVEDKSGVEQEEESAEDVLEGSGPVRSGEDMSDEDVESELFQDHELMADIGVELLDMVFVYSAMAIAGEKDEKPFEVSSQKKNRIKKPLAMLLKQRQTGVSPEFMVIVMVLAVYSPVMIKAVKERSKKKELKKKEKPNPFKEKYEGANIVRPKSQPYAKETPVRPIVPDEPKQERSEGERKPRKTLNEKEIQELLPKILRDKDREKMTYKQIQEKYDISESTAIRYYKMAKQQRAKSGGKK